MSSTEFPAGQDALLDQFGQIDIYIFDQLLRGRITPRMKVLDAGCGDGRNSRYLMRCGADVSGVDADPDQISRIQAVAPNALQRCPPVTSVSPGFRSCLSPTNTSTP